MNRDFLSLMPNQNILQVISPCGGLQYSSIDSERAISNSEAKGRDSVRTKRPDSPLACEWCSHCHSYKVNLKYTPPFPKALHICFFPKVRHGAKQGRINSPFGLEEKSIFGSRLVFPASPKPFTASQREFLHVGKLKVMSLVLPHP